MGKCRTRVDDLVMILDPVCTVDVSNSSTAYNGDSNSDSGSIYCLDDDDHATNDDCSVQPEKTWAFL